jgi:hypothetical protein
MQVICCLLDTLASGTPGDQTVAREYIGCLVSNTLLYPLSAPKRQCCYKIHNFECQLFVLLAGKELYS